MIMTADECTGWIAALPSEIAACYTLWDREKTVPVYVGTARSPSRIRSHLQKDRVRTGNLGKLIINRPFYDYVLGQPVGWLGISVDLFANEAQARRAEVYRIAEFGMRPNGPLFNRRSGG